MKKLSFFLMAMLFSVVSFAETYSLTPNKAQTGLTNTSYITTLTDFEYNGVAWKMNQWNPNSLQVKTNQGKAADEWRFYNTTAMPGKITKVVIKFSALALKNTSTTGFKFVGGSAAVTGTTGGTDGVWNASEKTLTWTPSASDNFTYFALYQNGKVASGTNKLATSDAIIVTYEAAGGSTETIVKTLKSIAVEGMTTTYEQGDIFKFDGTCTATYSVTKNDEPQADETKTVTPTVSVPNMNLLGTQTVTVAYTDDEVTVSTTYDINIIENTVTPGTYTGNLNNTFFGCAAENNGAELSGKFNDILVVSGCKENAQNKTYYDAAHVRFYADTYLKISVPEGYAITSIQLKEPTSNTKWDGSISVDKGTYTEDTKSWSGYEQEVQFSFGKQNRIASLTVTYELLDVKHIAVPIISGETEFVESTEISISAEDGLKVYYTLDGTDPTNASTEYTAPFTVSATTTVKAVAYDGENASDIASQTFKKLQVLTCEEAAELCAATESADKYVIRGYVTNVKYAYNEEYKTATFWIADTKDGGQVLQAYSAKPVAEIDKAVKVGDYVEAIGNLKLYNETPEITNGTYTIIPAPVVNHTITVSANPAEAGTVTGGGEYEEGATATLTATANEGYEFVKWTENEVEVSTDAEYTFEVLADRAIVANFELIPPTKFTVTVTAENGTVEGAGEYEEGAEATLTATANEGYEFVNWTEGEEVVSTAAEYTFEVLADRNLVANFKKKTYTVTANATNGTVEGAGTYEHAAEVTLTATAAEGYEFDNWTVGEETITENPYKFTVTADVSLVANFKEKEVAPTKLYLTPNANWKQSNARFAAYFFGNGETWVSMTKVAGETDLYEVTIPTDKKYPKVIFCRMNPSASANNWNNRWNQTDDLVIPTDVQNHYTVKEGTWDKGGGTWSIWPLPLVKTYKDITITVIANATPKIHYWEGGDKMVGSDWANKPEMVATGEENTYSYTIKDVDEATGVKYLVVVGDIQSADQITSVNVTKNFKEILPQVAVQGVNNWDGTDKMTVSDDYLTASITLSLAANNAYDLKLTVNGDWFGGNTIAITKDNNSAIFDTNGEGNGKITTDLAGGYVFTYTYATKTLTVAYPVSVTATAENGTVEGAGTYTHGTEVTLTATPDEGYEFVNWTAGKDTVSTEATYTFTVEADVNLVANFQEVVPVITHTVTFDYSVDAGYITVNDNRISEKKVKYAEGTELTVKALTFNNYRFDAWEDEEENELSITPEYTFTVTADVVLKAIITYIPGAVGTGVENNNVVTSETMKVIQNGRLFIIREGKIYNAQGQVVK